MNFTRGFLFQSGVGVGDQN